MSETTVSARPRRGRVSSRVWGVASGLAAAATPLVLLTILVVLAIFAWRSVVWNGLGFFTSTKWNLGNLYGGSLVVRHGIAAPQGAEYGMLVFVTGTLLSSAIAIVLAVPVGIGVAVALTSFSPRGLATVVSFFVELLAGVPSVVFGLWGFTVLVPWIGATVGPGMSKVLGFIPFFGGQAQTGLGLLASGIVLAVMIVPIITAVSRDALAKVPRELLEQGRALGLTEWEIVRDLSLPVARPAVIGAVILGLGRALGETMAVLMVSGSAVNSLPHNLYSPISTMASTIAAQLDSAMTDATGMAVHALAELAVVLFLITVLVNLLVKRIVRTLEQSPVLLWAERETE